MLLSTQPLVFIFYLGSHFSCSCHITTNGIFRRNLMFIELEHLSNSYPYPFLNNKFYNLWCYLWWQNDTWWMLFIRNNLICPLSIWFHSIDLFAHWWFCQHCRIIFPFQFSHKLILMNLEINEIAIHYSQIELFFFSWKYLSASFRHEAYFRKLTIRFVFFFSRLRKSRFLAYI